MGSQPVEWIDSVPALERELVSSMGLDRAAEDLGAIAAAVLLTEGSHTELTHFWSRISAGEQRRFDGQRSFPKALEGWSGPIDGRSPLALVLRDWITPDAGSFLPFQSRIQGRVVTTVFAFSEPVVPHHGLPIVLAEKLQLVGIATWSVREIARLKANLQIVNSRLARRKVVERAKGVLQTEQGLSEEQAYEHLRRASRRRRMPLTELAEEVLRSQARGSLATSLGHR